ncbi:MAG: hypothetical protein IAG10_03525 [Planctomycetaceae bacterium]|nr:hypothetical protein [Planctomycetaceae bacterium]
MTDLIVGCGIVTLACALMFAATVRFVRKRHPRQIRVAGVVVILVLAWFLIWGSESSVWSRLLPLSNLVVIGNLVPYCGAVLAGLAWVTSPGSRTRRSIPVVAIAVLGMFALVKPMLGQPPPCRDEWVDGICLQSSSVTCTAASAATLLREHGIAATEAEMAKLCLTRKGTGWKGLFRGLMLKTQGTDWTVRVREVSFESLRHERGPLILDVGVPLGAQVPEIYTTDYGWQPGVLHSVIFYGFHTDRVAIAEPTPGVGREEWSAEDLRILFRGRVYELAKRR